MLPLYPGEEGTHLDPVLPHGNVTLSRHHFQTGSLTPLARVCGAALFSAALCKALQEKEDEFVCRSWQRKRGSPRGHLRSAGDF